MPYKTPEAKLQRNREWRKKRIEEGYGKALYRRRKQRWDNELTLRTAITKAVELITSAQRTLSLDLALKRLEQVEDVLTQALVDAPPVYKMPIQLLEEDIKRAKGVTE